MNYYAEFCISAQTFDTCFIGTLERNADKVKWKWADITADLGDEAAVFLKKLICCTDLAVEQYREVLRPIRASYSSFGITGLTEEYIAAVIELGFISVTGENLKFIRSYYPNHVIQFLMQNNGVSAVELVEQSEGELNSEEIRGLLESKSFRFSTARRLLKACEKPISIESLKCSDEVCAVIVENYFNENNIPWILVRYDELGPKTKQAFLKTVKSHRIVLYNAAIDEEKLPVAVYATMIQELDPEDLRDLRKYLPNPDFEAVCTTNQKPKFSGTEEHRVILEFFKQQGWISSYQKLPSGKYQAFSTMKKTAGV